MILKLNQALIIISIVLSCYVHANNNLKVKKLGNCKAQLDNGQIIDISSLDNPNNPMDATSGIWDYIYNPCTPIKCGSVNTNICQEVKSKYSFAIGDADTVEFSMSGSDLAMQYTHGEKFSIVQCVCKTQSSFTFVAESPQNHYLMYLNDPCCCPDKCKSIDTTPKPSGPGSGGLSFGSILVIVFFSLLVVYLVGGIIFSKMYRQRSGKEMLPNYEFWIGVPSLVKDGVAFSWSKVTKKGSYTQIK